MTDHRTRAIELFARAIREADDIAELGRLSAIVTEIYADDGKAREGLLKEVEVRTNVLGARPKQGDIFDPGAPDGRE